MWKCKNCGHINGPYDDECRKCRSSKKKFAATDEKSLEEVKHFEESLSKKPARAKSPEEFFISALRICGMMG